MVNPGQVRYRLENDRRFRIEGYNWARPFSSYLPGIAGLWGIPMWVFYVNRGQGVISAGVRDKDHQVLEFQSFNHACQLAGLRGYRTFLRVDGRTFHEPFCRTVEEGLSQTMIVSSGELELSERHESLGLETRVVYFTLPGMPVPGLVRLLTLRNLGRRERTFELLDGVPRLLPHGMNQQHIKFTARHIEAMMGVSQTGGVPLFRLKQSAADSERIGRVEGGNFYASFGPGGRLLRGQALYDPAVIFGEPFDVSVPWVFLEAGLDGVRSGRQVPENRTPCAMTPFATILPPGGSVELASILGNVETDASLEAFLKTASRAGFLEARRLENQACVDEICSRSFTLSGRPEFDAYAGQNFLDNVIRGGLPLVFPTIRGKSAFYVYSRQNGDLERDYHHFVLEPTYLSQGTGHYRSVLQNRRMDAWFFPEVEDANLVTFMNLIQTDGYNPLEVRGLTYSCVDLPQAARLLRRLVPDATKLRPLLALLEDRFTPGEFLRRLEESTVSPSFDRRALLEELLPLCQENDVGGLHEGYWIDHWFYNLDLLDTFLAVYPDRLEELLVGRPDYSFYDDPDVVVPRAEKLQLVEGRVRQYRSVRRDAEKLALIGSRKVDAARMRTDHGHGPIYRTTLLVKLLSLVANRVATLDPFGVGLEMESDKPGWNDSMNGLPGLLGSSLGETLQLLRACRFLASAMARIMPGRNDPNDRVRLFEELARFIKTLDGQLTRRLRSRAGNRALAFWRASHNAKELYREQTRMGVSGREVEVPAGDLRAFLDRCTALLEQIFAGPGRERILSPEGVPYTYFINEVTRWKPLVEGKGRQARPRLSSLGNPLVEPLAFEQRPVALFLEGPMHYLKVRGGEEAQAVYGAVRQSALFDRKLRMYRSCEPLTAEPFEIGRVGVYPRGWIENESIYLHMEYKYLLEVLRAGLHREFFRDLQTMLVCFLDPKTYGRSVLEGASFITSSANRDPGLHGQAFQPRQSGITCEMIHLWTVMVAGERPFGLDHAGRLTLRLRPVLARSFFTDAPSTAQGLELPAGAFAFRFLGRTLVVYHNPSRRDTFGVSGAEPRRYRLTYADGCLLTVDGALLEEQPARDVREGRVERLDVELG